MNKKGEAMHSMEQIMLKGWEEGQTVPISCKDTLTMEQIAVQLANTLCEAGKNVLIINMETNSKAFYFKYNSQPNIFNQKIKVINPPDNRFRAQEITELIREECGKRPFDYVLIIYLQMISHGGMAADTYENMHSEAFREIKRFATACGVTTAVFHFPYDSEHEIRDCKYRIAVSPNEFLGGTDRQIKRVEIRRICDEGYWQKIEFKIINIEGTYSILRK